MKKLLLLLAMVLAFNLSNAQEIKMLVNPQISMNASVFIDDKINEIDELSLQVEVSLDIVDKYVTLSGIMGRIYLDGVFTNEDNLGFYFVGGRMTFAYPTNIVTPYFLLGANSLLADNTALELNYGFGVKKEFGNVILASQYEELLSLKAITIKLGYKF